MKRRKAVALDNIVVELWKSLGEVMVVFFFFFFLFSTILESERMPEEWRRTFFRRRETCRVVETTKEYN